jgi:hypothetical protein
MSEDEKEVARAEMQKLEAKLRDAKDTDKGPTNKLKLQLREARQRFRELRDANPDPVGSGDATVKAGFG